MLKRESYTKYCKINLNNFLVKKLTLIYQEFYAFMGPKFLKTD